VLEQTHADELAKVIVMKPYGPERKPRTTTPRVPTPRPKYQWPANKITPADMAILYHLRARTGAPINRLIQEAIRMHFGLWGLCAKGKRQRASFE